ncbi:hypothetical protein B6U80_01185 [Candidatus Pacearchaeota archaeon ex4484_26]|nr:MAG: hypothetical protein B6U80_01185 [Candidatus Pacearchaeota archaeon ex4484_26]
MISDLALNYPAVFMIVISFIISIFITLIYKYATNQQEMKRLKDELKELQKKAKEHKNEPEKVLEIQKELASKNLEYMKHSFKPMIYTFIPIIIVFWWLKGLYQDFGTILTIPFVGWGLNWIWTYIIFSFIFSLIVRKAVKVY